MGYLNPHGTCPGIRGTFIGRHFGADVDEDTPRGRGSWVDRDSLLSFQEWLCPNDEGVLDQNLEHDTWASINSPEDLVGDHDLNEDDWLEQKYGKYMVNGYHIIPEDEEINDLLFEEDEELDPEEWVGMKYGSYDDEVNLDNDRFDTFTTFQLSAKCGWYSKRYNYRRWYGSHGKHGRKQNGRRSRKWTEASWLGYYGHDFFETCDPSYGDGRTGSWCCPTLEEMLVPDAGESSHDLSSFREVVIEYPYREVREIRTEQYYHHLLQNCNFSLAKYADEGDGYFSDTERFESHREAHEAELESMARELWVYSELRIKYRPQTQWSENSLFWLDDLVDYDAYEDEGSYPDYDPYTEYNREYDRRVLDSSNDDDYAAACWAAIDQQLEEEARDRDPAPAFGGSNRNHLRLRNPRGDRERHIA